jgi:hypothetical protein
VPWPNKKGYVSTDTHPCTRTDTHPHYKIWQDTTYDMKKKS